MKIYFFLVFAIVVATFSVSFGEDCSNCYTTICLDGKRKSCVQTQQPNWCLCECFGNGTLDCDCDCFRADQQAGGECCGYGKKGSCGCPFLHAYVNGTYNRENSLMPASQYSNGLDVVDYMLLNDSLTLYNGKYLFLISENEDNKHGYFDQVTMLAVDHPQTVDVGTTCDNKILTWFQTKLPDFCVDKDGNDQLAKIVVKGDSNYWQGLAGDYLVVGFIGVGQIPGWGNGIAVLGCIDDFIGFWINLIKVIFTVYVPEEPNGDWCPVGNLFLRQKPSQIMTSLPHNFPQHSRNSIPETLLIRIQLNTPGSLDQFLLTNAAETSFVSQVCPLSYAQNKEGDILSSLLTVDSVYAELPAHSYFELGFLPPRNACPQGWKRDFVFVSTGRYITIGNLIPIAESPKKPSKLIFAVKPTNFRSQTEISYMIPDKARVFIGAYDLTGRLVANLENRYAEPGRYSIIWDGSNDRGEQLSSGAYFLKLTAGKAAVTKKVVILR